MISESDRVANRRYRFLDKDGKPYPPFRLKPGMTLSQMAEKAFPGKKQGDDWDVEVA